MVAAAAIAGAKADTGWGAALAAALAAAIAAAAATPATAAAGRVQIACWACPTPMPAVVLGLCAGAPTVSKGLALAVPPRGIKGGTALSCDWAAPPSATNQAEPARQGV
jgi:hypothetical protein